MASTRNAESTRAVAVPELAELDGDIIEGEIVDEPVTPVVQAVIVRPVQVDPGRGEARPRQGGRAAPRVHPARARCRGQAAVGQPVRRPGTSGSSGQPSRPATTRPHWSGRTGGRSSSRTATSGASTWSSCPSRCCWRVPKIALGLFVVLAVLGIFLAIGTKHIGEIVAPFEVVAHIVEVDRASRSRSRGVRSLLAAAVDRRGRAVVGRPGACQREHDRLAVAAARTTTTPASWSRPTRSSWRSRTSPRSRRCRRAFKDGWRPTFHTLPVRDGRGYAAVFSAAARRHGGDDRRPAAGAGPERAPRRDRGVAVRRRAGRDRAGRDRRGVDRRPGRAVASPRRSTRCCTRAPPTCSRACPAASRRAATRCSIPIVGNNVVARRPDGPGQVATPAAWSCSAARWTRWPSWTCSCSPTTATSTPTRRGWRGTQGRRGRRDRGRRAAGCTSCTRRSAAVRRGSPSWAPRRSRGSWRRPTRTCGPIVALFSECHELFGHAEYGEMAAELATKTIKRARKTGITLLFDTQSQPQGGDPAEAGRAGQRQRAASTSRRGGRNDGFLGDGVVRRGHPGDRAAPGPRPGHVADHGRLSDAQFELLRWYFVEVDDDTGYDAAAEVIARAMAERRAGHAGRRPASPRARDRGARPARRPGRGARRRAGEAPRPGGRVLRDLAPTWAPYRKMTATQLRDDLAAEGVRTVNSSGTPYLDPADLRRALADRNGPVRAK